MFNSLTRYITRYFIPILPCTVMLGSLLVYSVPAIAQDTGAVGGSGGRQFSIPCPEGQALIGIGGTTFAVGNFVDSVFGRCSPVHPGGSRFGQITTTPGASGTGGSERASCPSPQVVSGIRVTPSVVTAGTLVGGISLLCKSIGNDGRTTGNATLVQGFTAGSGLSTPTDLNCPNNLPGRGFHGRAGDFVDSIGLQCGLPDISPPVVSSLTLSNATVLGSRTVTATVTLNKPAPPSGANVTLESNAPAIITFSPSPLQIATQPTGTFEVRTVPVATSTNVNVTATLGQSSRSAALRVNPPTVTSLVFLGPSEVTTGTLTGGTRVDGQVRLDGPAPNGFKVSLTNSNTNAAQRPSPFEVEVTAGQLSQSFSIETRPVITDTTVTIGASATVSRAFTVRAPRMQSLSLSATHVIGGGPVTGTATLTGPLGPGGFEGGLSGGNLNGISLSSSNPAAATVPSIVIGRSEPSVTFPVTLGGSNSSQCTEITGTINNSNRSAFLGVSPAQSSELTFSLPSTNNIAVGQALSGTVASFATGLSSSDPDVALGAMLPRPDGVNLIRITGRSQGCAMITATKTGPSGVTIRRSIMVVVGIIISG
ncbi:MAG: hypothetical protein M3410_10145 [Acidobacteriota bacterium]|nr:hypothetical protein [Acidobacteriota bacterium]